MVDGSGRKARGPTQIGRDGWRDIAWRIWQRFNDNRLLLVSAGATFYLLLSIVPLLAIFVALYGLVFDASNVVSQINQVAPYLPGDARTIVEDQLKRLVSESDIRLGLTVAVSFIVALWSASGATKALIEGLNIVNAETEQRSFFKRNAIALAMTLIGVIGSILALGVSIALPAALNRFAPYASQFVPVVSNVLVAALMVVGVGALYRWGPSREPARWRWLTPGSVLAVAAILGFTIAFGWYARTFSTYSAYGSLGTIIGFMTWGWVCMLLLLLGAQINTAIEHQTAQDSTTGRPVPMGRRGAVMADTLGRHAGQDDRTRRFYGPAASHVSLTPLVVATAIVIASVVLAQRR